MIEITLHANHKLPAPSALLYTLVSAYLEYTAQNGDESLSALADEQQTLTAYCYLDSQVEEGGFGQLIASGYGEYIFRNPLADSLRRWRIKITPKIIDTHKSLYEKNASTTESRADERRTSLSLPKLF
uniref:DMP19 family protein n=1 Tax=Neisseria cinerea TaxID=483 RepID=UPI002B1DB123